MKNLTSNKVWITVNLTVDSVVVHGPILLLLLLFVIILREFKESAIKNNRGDLGKYKQHIKSRRKLVHIFTDE